MNHSTCNYIIGCQMIQTRVITLQYYQYIIVLGNNNNFKNTNKLLIGARLSRGRSRWGLQN